MTVSAEPAEILAALQSEPHRPRLVWQAPQGRTELSGATLSNWIAKVSGLLRDELGLRTGDTAAVCPAQSWQAVAAVCGCLWAGLTISPSRDGTAEVAFVDAGDDAAADEVFALSTHPFGAPTDEIPAHQRHFTEAVLVQSDRPAPPSPGEVALTGGAEAITTTALAGMTRSAAARLSTADAGDVPCPIWDGSAPTLAAWLAAWANGRGVAVSLPA